MRAVPTRSCHVSKTCPQKGPWKQRGPWPTTRCPTWLFMPPTVSFFFLASLQSTLIDWLSFDRSIDSVESLLLRTQSNNLPVRIWEEKDRYGGGGRRRGLLPGRGSDEVGADALGAAHHPRRVRPPHRVLPRRPRPPPIQRRTHLLLSFFFFFSFSNAD